MMNEALVEQIKEDIERAFHNRDSIKIQKETLFIFDRVIHFLLSHGKNRLRGITFENNEINFNEKYLLSKKNKSQIYRMLGEISEAKQYIKDSTFGRLRIDIERWYRHFGGEAIHFEYKRNYLITRQKATEFLGISIELLNEFTNQGLETTNTRDTRCIPMHAVVLWKNPVYAIRMQMLEHEKQTAHAKLETQPQNHQ